MRFDVGIIIEGGVGKHIAFSAALSEARKRYGEIVLVSAYPEVFVGNESVARNLSFSFPYLYEDYLKDIKLFKLEPYLEDEYRLQKKHIIDVFASRLGIECERKPEVKILQQEEQEFLAFREKVLENKNYLVIQIRGGTPPLNPELAKQKAHFTRDYPEELAQKFVDLFRKKYPDWYIVQIGLPTEPKLHDCVYLTNLPVRAYFPVLKYCNTFVVIDSFLNHLSAALGKRGVVLWGGTNPSNLGYEHNINLYDTSLCEEIFCGRPGVFDHSWKCKRNFSCMRIQPELILEKVSSLIDAKV